MVITICKDMAFCIVLEVQPPQTVLKVHHLILDGYGQRGDVLLEGVYSDVNLAGGDPHTICCEDIQGSAVPCTSRTRFFQ